MGLVIEGVDGWGRGGGVIVRFRVLYCTIDGKERTRAVMIMNNE